MFYISTFSTKHSVGLTPSQYVTQGNISLKKRYERKGVMYGLSSSNTVKYEDHVTYSSVVFSPVPPSQ